MEGSETKGIVGWIRRLRKVDGESDRRMGVMPNIAGQCARNETVADGLGGEAWRSYEAKGHESQAYPQHTVAVIPLKRGKAVVDYSQEDPILGVGEREEDTPSLLRRLTGYGGWRKSPRQEVDLE